MKLKELTLSELYNNMPYNGLAQLIDKKNYKAIFSSNINNLMYKSLMSKLNEIYNNEDLAKRIIKDLNMYYYPTSSGYKISIYPVAILNNILSICGINHSTRRFYNLDDEKEYNEIRQRFVNCFEYYRENISNPYILDIIDKTITNIDSILKIDTNDFENTINNMIVPKNTLFFLAYTSLLKLIETKNKDYAKLPYIYYNHYSKGSSYSWPKKIVIDNNLVWLDGFDRLYQSVLKENPELLSFDYDIIKGAKLTDDISIYPSSDYKSSFNESNVHDYNVKDYTMLGRKLKLYNDKRIKYVIGSSEFLDGYLGFVCNNDNVIFDKLYDENGYRVPAKNCAIYVIPADSIGLIQKSKSELIQIINEEKIPNMHRYYHTKNFEEKVLRIMHEERTSTKTFEEMMDSDKRLVLKKRIH